MWLDRKGSASCIQYSDNSYILLLGYNLHVFKIVSLLYIGRFLSSVNKRYNETSNSSELLVFLLCLQLTTSVYTCLSHHRCISLSNSACSIKHLTANLYAQYRQIIIYIIITMNIPYIIYIINPFHIFIVSSPRPASSI